MTKHSLSTILLLPLAGMMTAGCEVRTDQTTENATNAVDPAATAPQNDTNATAPETATPPEGFSVDSVPLTTVSLPPFPFFKVPDGLTSTYSAKEQNISFAGQYFMVGEKPTVVEGKIFRDRFSLTGDRPYSDLEFHKNYENAITALGGRKVSAAQYTGEIVAAAGGRAALDQHNYAAIPAPNYRHESYLLRTADKEYWIEISTGSYPLHGYVVVLEKQVMKQSVAFLDAAAMKAAIDKTGRVALYINFDVDKATLRPDAQPVLDEINKLLTQTPGLKLSVEGHTDNTGQAAHNRNLSAARARGVMGALIGLGIDPARLQSKGFGPDKPLTGNDTEEGRAKNRRVELVKI